MSKTLERYLLDNLDQHIDELDFEHEQEIEDFKNLMIEQINDGSDLIEICSLMEVPKSKVLEYFDEDSIKRSMMEIYGNEEYQFNY